jgi:uncharacterized protein
MTTITTAAEMIALLALEPHPEGGFYRETFRDASLDADGRARSTAIYFLLPRGVVSRWHKVDAAEVWHWYAGAPLALSIKASGRDVVDHVLGQDIVAGERPQAVVPPGAWQRAQSLGEWTLVGCTVAPGFLFEHFEIAGGEPPA